MLEREASTQGTKLNTFSQQRRLITALVYAVSFLFVHLALFGSFPPLSPQGLWFYTGLLVLLFGVALGEPFYTTPARAVLNGGAVAVATAAFPTEIAAAFALEAPKVQVIKILLFLTAIVAACAGVLAILTKDQSGKIGRVSQAGTLAAARIGNARLLYSAFLLGTAFAAHGQDPTATASIFATWLVVVVMQPIERLPTGIDIQGRLNPPLGTVFAIEAPGLVHARTFSTSLTKGNTVEFATTGGSAAVLDSVAIGDEAWALLAITGRRIPYVGESFEAGPKQERLEVIGTVDDGSNLDLIRFRAPAELEGVSEGQMVSVAVQGKEVLYQVIAANIRSITIHTDTRYHYLDVGARKLGSWNDTEDRLELASWLPQPTGLVKGYQTRAPTFAPEHIGKLPGTDFGVSVDTNALVTHNTAILGILGVGKTYLCFELIRRILADGIKVIALDITGEYAPQFREQFPEWYERRTYEGVQQATSGHHDTISKNVHEGGSITKFREVIRADLTDFLASPELIKIYEPDAFEATRQDGKIFSGSAPIAPLTVAEITAIISDELLKAVRDLGASNEARVCVVLEEAHSLAPEWNSTSYEGDQRASNRTAKAILQGRKYGLGALVVTQRTANVTKTVLNQCHTIMALRSHDATGIEFLKNYMGEEVSSVLTTLGYRRAAVFGKASSCPSPAIVQLNEHGEMVSGFWEAQKSSVPVPSDAPDSAGEEASAKPDLEQEEEDECPWEGFSAEGE